MGFFKSLVESTVVFFAALATTIAQRIVNKKPKKMTKKNHPQKDLLLF